jgi:hypothetical protein
MFAATGDPVCQQKLIEWYNPAGPETIRWGWWHLFEGYGCAARSYSFAVKNGKRSAGEMDAVYLNRTRQAIMAAGAAIQSRSMRGAYGSSLDVSSKRQNTAGWFFSSDRAFDITAWNALEPVSNYQTQVISNINYELGCNPLNVSFITGAGQRQQHEIVHQYANNDDRQLPPSGIPLGNIQAGFTWTNLYESELNQLNFPYDWTDTHKYPLYDRWGDTFNTTTEFVIAQQARALGSLAGIAAATASGKNQPWRTAMPEILCPPGFLLQNETVTFQVECAGLNLEEARVTWETADQVWIGGPRFDYTPTRTGNKWIEVEILLPDGKRVSAIKHFGVRAMSGGSPQMVDDTTVALYQFDDGFDDSSPNSFHLSKSGRVELDLIATGWMSHPSGKAVRFYGIGDKLTVTIPDVYLSPAVSATPLTLEAWICPHGYTSYGKANAPVMSLQQAWNSQFGIMQDMWIKPSQPYITTDGIQLIDHEAWGQHIQMGTWQHIAIIRESSGNYQFRVNGQTVATGSNIGGYGGAGDWQLTLGNFNGFLDDLKISGMPNHGRNPVPIHEVPPDSVGSGASTPLELPSDYVISPFGKTFQADENTIALYHFDGDYADSSVNQYHLNPIGGASRVPAFDCEGNPKGKPSGFRILVTR